MAIPTMTNNSPSAGYIAWGAFTIQLYGVAYSVSAGSTNQRWVWWEYKNGVPVITAGADVPTTLTADDLVLFANKNGIGVRVQSSSFVDGELLVDGSIFADALSTNLINTQHIVTAGLDAAVVKFGVMSGDRIAVNTLQGDRILANSILTSKLAVADWENYVSDPYFDLARWTLSTGVNVTTSPSMPLGIGTGNLLRFNGVNGTTLVASCMDMFTTNASDTLRASVLVRKITNAASPTGSVNLRVRHYDAAGNNSTPFYLETSMLTSAMVQNTWYEMVIDPVLIPASKTDGRIELLTVGVNALDNFDFAVPQVNKKKNGKLIVDGSIVATQLATDSVTSTKIAANAVTANKIAAQAIDVSKLNVGDITNYVVDGDLFDATSANWDMASVPAPVRVDPVGGLPYFELTVNPAGNSFLRNEHKFEAHPGDEYWIEAEVQTPATNVDTLTLNLAFSTWDVDGASLLWRPLPTAATVAPNTDWTKVNGVLLIDSSDSVASAKFNPYVVASTTANQKLRVRKIVVRKRSSGELIVDGSIQAKHLEIETVSAAIINTKILQSQLAITGNLTIDGGNMGWSAAQGLYLGDDVVFYGDSRTNRIEGDLVTQSLTVKDGLSIGGNADVHGTIVAANGVPTPTNKMTLSQMWPRLGITAMNGGTGQGTDDQSAFNQDMCEFDANTWITAFNYVGTGFRKWTKSDGGWAGDIALGSWRTTFYPNGGTAKIGSDIYTIGSDSNRSGDYYVYRISSTSGAKLGETRMGAIHAFGDKRVRLITDGTNVGVIWTSATSGNLILRWYNAALTATVGSDTVLWAAMGNAHVGGAHYGIGQVGGPTRIWVSMQTGDANMIRCFTTAGAKVPTEDFPRAYNATVCGLAYDPSVGRMKSFDKYMSQYTYSLYTAGGTLNAQQTYYDGDSAVYPAGTIINGTDKSGVVSGPHETPPGPVTSLALGRRAWPVITALSAPDELVTDVTQVDKADRSGIYASVGGTPVFQAYLAKGVRDLPVTDTLITTGTLAGASTVPSFATASVPAPGRIRSSAEMPAGSPIWDLQGSGAGRAGPLLWDVGGKPLNHGEWATVTAQSFANNTWTKRTGFTQRHAGSTPHGITYNTSTGDFTISQAGLYLVAGVIGWAATGTGRRISAFYLGSAILFRSEAQQPSTSTQSASPVSGVLYATAGAVISLQGYQSSGAALAGDNNPEVNYCTITCLAAF